MDHGVHGEQPRPDHQPSDAADLELPAPSSAGNQIPGAPAGSVALAAQTPHLIRRHNLWLAQLRRRDRIVQTVTMLALLAGAAGALLGGNALAPRHTAGLVVFLVCLLLFVICCTAFSPWGARVGHRKRGTSRRRPQKEGRR